MKFHLSTSGYFYKRDRIKKLEKLGFTFRNYGAKHCDDTLIICDEIDIEFNTLEELIEFTSEWGGCVIDGDSIEIYDNYRE